jgi:hypothetical protein
MKQPLIILAMLAVAALCASTSCDENGDPEGPTTYSSDYSGTFDVDFQLDQNSCDSPPPLMGFETITMSGDDFDWGSISGTWDEEEQRGTGASDEQCIPVQPPAGCLACYTIEFDITFANPDSFYGEVNVPVSFTSECQASNCLSAYDVTGVRAD